jgi:hypothetical protein
MYLGNLNETVIIIDTDFLNERISENLAFYKDLYPNKKFEKINLANLMYNFALNARVDEPGNKVDILFAYTLFNSNLEYCTPSNLTVEISCDGVEMQTEIGTFLIRSFFANEGETCIEHFNSLLRIIDGSLRVSRIIVISDNDLLNHQLRHMENKKEKSLLMLRNYYNTQIDDDIDIKFVNINYIIAESLGLKSEEI